jgi:hypothetical protein
MAASARHSPQVPYNTPVVCQPSPAGGFGKQAAITSTTLELCCDCEAGLRQRQRAGLLGLAVAGLLLRRYVNKEGMHGEGRAFDIAKGHLPEQQRSRRRSPPELDRPETEPSM